MTSASAMAALNPAAATIKKAPPTSRPSPRRTRRGPSRPRRLRLVRRHTTPPWWPIRKRGGTGEGREEASGHTARGAPLRPAPLKDPRAAENDRAHVRTLMITLVVWESRKAPRGACKARQSLCSVSRIHLGLGYRFITPPSLE